jgi:hypothetical protein
MKKRPGAKAPDLWRFVVGLKPYAKPKYDDEDKDNNDDYNSGSLRDDKQNDKQRLHCVQDDNVKQATTKAKSKDDKNNYNCNKKDSELGKNIIRSFWLFSLRLF